MMALSRVDFPAPLPPQRMMISPGQMSKLTSNSTAVPSYPARRSCTASLGTSSARRRSDTGRGPSLFGQSLAPRDGGTAGARAEVVRLHLGVGGHVEGLAVREGAPLGQHVHRVAALQYRLHVVL